VEGIRGVNENEDVECVVISTGQDREGDGVRRVIGQIRIMTPGHFLKVKDNKRIHLLFNTMYR
jgi:UDP-N-acetylglucosamine 2-epimerase